MFRRTCGSGSSSQVDTLNLRVHLLCAVRHAYRGVAENRGGEGGGSEMLSQSPRGTHKIQTCKIFWHARETTPPHRRNAKAKAEKKKIGTREWCRWCVRWENRKKILNNDDIELNAKRNYVCRCDAVVAAPRNEGTRGYWMRIGIGCRALGTTNTKGVRLVCKLTTEDIRYSIGVPSHCRATFPKHKQSIFFESSKARPRAQAPPTSPPAHKHSRTTSTMD